MGDTVALYVVLTHIVAALVSQASPDRRGYNRSSMRYAQFPAPPQLTPWVECVWRLTGHRSDGESAQRVFPDGCLELVIHLGDPFRARIDTGDLQTQPRRLVVGQMVQAVTLEPTGRVDVWGVRVHPWGARLLFEGPASHLTGRIEHAGDVAPDLAQALVDAIADGRAPEALSVQALCRVLERRARATATPDRLCADAAAWLLAAPATSLVHLAHRGGLSPRQFERRFLAGVGLTPKTFARIARFQRVCALLGAAPETLSAAAVACGYYDQSHLSRDARAFAGSTPARLRQDDSPLAEHFLRARRMSGFSKTRAASLA
jgi:AraC-like DNA-binding protein